MRDHAAAFAPAHVTGLFEICDEGDDVLAIGSRGVGFSVSLGVETRVRIGRESMPGVTVRANGHAIQAATTRRAVQILAGHHDVSVDVEQTYTLPVGHGFGVSAAAALSAAMAVAECLDVPSEDALKAAHQAEILERTGLGDVVGSYVGGFEVRTRPGLPPHGHVEPWLASHAVDNVVLVAMDAEVSTARVLADPDRRLQIQQAGRQGMHDFLSAPSLQSFATLSRTFSEDAGLMTSSVRAALKAVDSHAQAAQAQLGTSMFAFNVDAAALRTLATFGHVYRCTVATQGARVTPKA